MSNPTPEGLPVRAILGWLVATWALLFVVQLIGPPDLMDNDQERPTAYVLDALVHGNWIVQRDSTGDITSKPPFYTWTVAITAKLFGSFNRFTLYLPGALAVLGMTLLTFAAGRRVFGPAAGLLAAGIYLLSGTAFKQLVLARTDAMFALLVTVAVVLAWRATHRETHWVWFWIVAALATLTKGPLGLLLALGGCLAVLWDRWENREKLLQSDDEEVILSNLYGLMVYLVIGGLWFYFAWLTAGQALIAKMIGKELVGHALQSDGGGRSLLMLPVPFLYFLSRSLPWSLLTIGAIFHLLRRNFPANPAQRFALRFAFAQFAVGLLVFSIVPHQRPDHLFPLLPAAAFLGGAFAAQWITEARLRRALWLLPATTILVAGGGVLFNATLRPKERRVRQTIMVRDFAREILAKTGNAQPLLHPSGIENPFALQFYLGTMTPHITPAQAIAALQSNKPAFVVVRDWDKWRAELRKADAPDFPWVLQIPKTGNPWLRIVSNQPKYKRLDDGVFWAGPIKYELWGMRLGNWREGEITASVRQTKWSLTALNSSRKPLEIQYKIKGEDGLSLQGKRILKPGMIEIIAERRGGDVLEPGAAKFRQ